jgi:hypothetical protein
VGIATRPCRGRYDFVADQLQDVTPCDILDVVGVKTTEVKWLDVTGARCVQQRDEPCSEDRDDVHRAGLTGRASATSRASKRAAGATARAVSPLHARVGRPLLGLQVATRDAWPLAICTSPSWTCPGKIWWLALTKDVDIDDEATQCASETPKRPGNIASPSMDLNGTGAWSSHEPVAMDGRGGLDETCRPHQPSAAVRCPAEVG